MPPPGFPPATRTRWCWEGAVGGCAAEGRVPAAWRAVASPQHGGQPEGAGFSGHGKRGGRGRPPVAVGQGEASRAPECGWESGPGAGGHPERWG